MAGLAESIALVSDVPKCLQMVRGNTKRLNCFKVKLCVEIVHLEYRCVNGECVIAFQKEMDYWRSNVCVGFGGWEIDLSVP